MTSPQSTEDEGVTTATIHGDRAPRPLRVLILNQPFHPDVVATAQIAKDLADALTARGRRVTAVASRSIYGAKGAALPKRETVDGIEIVRAGAARFGKGSVLGRVLDFAGYALRAAWLSVAGPRPDVVVCLTTPPFIVLVGLFVRRLRGSRLVYWVMDVYPDVMVAHGMLREGGAGRRFLRALHAHALRRADAVVALGECMKRRLAEQGASGANVSVVPVWSTAQEENADARSAAPADDNEYRRRWGVAPDQLLVMYAGNFGLAHDVETFLSAAETLRDDERVRFAFVGGGKRYAHVEGAVRERALTNCALDGYQPRDRLAALLAAADAHLTTMAPEWWGLVVPSKFFGVASAGRPCAFVGPAQSDVARLIREWGAGSVIEPGDAAGLVRVLQGWAADKQRGGQELGRLGAAARIGARGWADRTEGLNALAALVEGRTAAAPQGLGAAETDTARGVCA